MNKINPTKGIIAAVLALVLAAVLLAGVLPVVLGAPGLQGPLSPTGTRVPV